nr:winged helix-turn-helix domain-containing protein [Paracoccus zhejiangensis]
MTKARKTLLIGAFRFNSENEELTSPDGTKVPLRPQTARVLRLLAQNRGRLVTKESLMREVWPDTHVTDDSLVQCISEIRRALGGEDAKRLTTVPKQGYRLTAAPAPDDAPPSAVLVLPGQEYTRRRPGLRVIVALVATVVALFIVVAAAETFLGRDAAPQEPVTIAVLPFENLRPDRHSAQPDHSCGKQDKA